MNNRDQVFGRLLAIANVISQRVYDKNELKVSDKHMTRIAHHPRKAIEKIHNELMNHVSKFGPDELQLMDLFGEVMANLDASDFTNEPLGNYIHAYHTQQHTLNNIMGVEEAAELWGYSSPGTIKNMCRDGKVKAVKIGKTWVIDKNQPNPKIE